MGEPADLAVPRHSSDFALGSPDYLVSVRRHDILDRRARFSGHG